MSFVVTGHRGAMGVEPENTLRSFRRAAVDGADEIELDLRVSADGHLVICHDATVERTTDGQGAVAELTLAELQALDAGGGERVPTFAEVLDHVDLPIQAELKAADAVSHLAALLAGSADLRARVTVAGFDDERVAEVVRTVPGSVGALIVREVTDGLIERVRSIGATKVFCGWAGLDAEFVGRAHAAGLLVTGWPAPTEVEVALALDLGLDGLTTDLPAMARTAVDTLRPETATPR